VLALACDAKKKQGGAAPASRAAGERCEAAKTAQQLIKRARKLDREAAIGCLEAGSRRFETSGELWEEYGALSDDMGMRHEALEMLERALALKPTLGLAALRLGNIYASLSDDDRAIQFFKKARKARPDSPVPYNNIGLAHMRHGRMQVNACATSPSSHDHLMHCGKYQTTETWAGRVGDNESDK